MDSDTKPIPLSGITFRDNIPVDWKVITDSPGDGELHHQNRANEELLQNLLLRDEASQDPDIAEETVAHEHLKRLETKVDLMLNMLTEIMASKEGQPQPHDVLIGTQGLCVFNPDSANLLKVNALLKIRLYIDSQFPRPLHIYGRIIELQADKFTVDYCLHEPRFQDLLDKLVFCRHRRAIALAKKTRPGE